MHTAKPRFPRPALPGSRRSQSRFAAAALLGTLLSGCVTTNPTPTAGTSTSVTCGVFAAITYSSKDTDLTQRQVKRHNGSYNALCAPKELRR